MHSSPSPVEVAHPLKRAHVALCKDSKDKSMSHNGRVKTSKVKQMLGSLQGFNDKPNCLQFGIILHSWCNLKSDHS